MGRNATRIHGPLAVLGLSFVLVCLSIVAALLLTSSLGFLRPSSSARAEGTAHLVNDINPSRGSGSSQPWGFWPIGGAVYFLANDGLHGQELWKSDGTETGTYLVEDIRPGTSSPQYWGISNVDGVLYFCANFSGSNCEVWKSDGTEEGTVMVKDIHQDRWGSNPSKVVQTPGGKVVFAAWNDQWGREVWQSDGTEAGTTLLQDIAPWGASSNPGDFIVVGSTLFFRANDNASGNELWAQSGLPVVYNLFLPTVGKTYSGGW